MPVHNRDTDEFGSIAKSAPPALLLRAIWCESIPLQMLVYDRIVNGAGTTPNSALLGSFFGAISLGAMLLHMPVHSRKCLSCC